jgi:hypothetical protein
MLGCQPSVCDDLIIGLSEPVERAVETSVERLIDEIVRLTAAPKPDGPIRKRRGRATWRL